MRPDTFTHPDLFTDLHRVPAPLTPVQVELTRRAGNKWKVLARLQEGPATNVELLAIAGIAFGQRKRELTKEGYQITVENISGGLFRYTLVKP